MPECAEEIFVTGLVQGVGFRPFVWRLAQKLGLRGYVSNRGDGVRIVVVGPPERVAALVDALASPPPRARIVAISRSTAQDEGWQGFTIQASLVRCRLALWRIWLYAPPALRKLRIKKTAAISMLLQTAQIADHVFPLSPAFRMIVPARPWRPLPCAPPVGPNMPTRRTGASMPSPLPARCAAPG